MRVCIYTHYHWRIQSRHENPTRTSAGWTGRKVSKHNKNSLIMVPVLAKVVAMAGGGGAADDDNDYSLLVPALQQPKPIAMTTLHG